MKHLSSFLLLICGSLLSLTTLAQSTTIYVRENGSNTDPATATSWANALSGTALQGVLATAPAGTTFLVGAGLYKPTTGADRSFSFSIPSGVQVYGGYAGSGATPDVRTAFPSSTTLSGDINSPGNAADNSYHVVKFKNASTNTRLDGAVITNGYAGNSEDDSPDGRGGGIYNDGSNGGSSNPTLFNLSLVNNQAFNSGGALHNNGDGGNSSPTLTNVSFFK
ncbi:hypothetical protein GCM10027341_38810 [Spirosoma knui]